MELYLKSLIPKLLNNPLAWCCLMNLDFLLLHISQFDCIIDLLCLFLTILGLIFLVYSYMINSKFLLSSFISVADTSVLHVICFLLK